MAQQIFILATEEMYCESNGAFDILHVCDEHGNVDFITLRGDEVAPSLPKASAELRAIAAQNFINNKCDINAKRGHIGCTVILQRSRKAPNKVELTVLDYAEAHYDARFNQWVDAKVAVDVEGSKVWVNASCIKEIVKGKRPYWA